MPKQVAQFDPVTNEYIGQATAFENPQARFDGVPFNIPGGCADIEVPPHKEGFARIREGSAVVYIVDHRGKTVFLTTDKTPKLVTELGEMPKLVIPEGYTLQEPGRFSVWEKTKWIDDEKAVEAAKTEENNAPLKAALVNVDIQTIRSLREWVMSQPDAPAFTKEQEKAAQELRKKLMK